jgi:pimeloyl-ACP methyl ester carboxylesterase
MAIDRHQARGRKIGSLVINPGGPGESGVDYLPAAMGTLSSSLASRFDIVGFDPPGVGRSAPIACADPAGMAAWLHADPAPTTAAGLSALVATDRQFAEGCERLSGAELPYTSTVDAARDLDVLRSDLGDPKLTYIGFSYGTLIGATYASLFPQNVRALVLDGPVDPAVPHLEALQQQAASLDAQLQSFFAWCSGSSDCGWNPPGSEVSAFESLVARVRNNPLAVKGSSRTVGPSELYLGTAAALYSPDSWPYLGQALARADAGDGSELLAMFDSYTGRQPDGTYANIFEANAAVSCLDNPPASIAQIQADLPSVVAAAPLFGAANLYGELECDVWPVKATGTAGSVRAPGAPPIVVVGSTGDPVTPYSWAVGLAGELGSGVLVTRVGDGHTGYRFSSCVRKAVDAYLIATTVPPAGTRCGSS